IGDSVITLVQSQGKIGILGQSVEAQPAGTRDRRMAQRADRAGHDGDAIPAMVGATVEIEAAGVLKRLTARDEAAQVADFGVPGNGDDAPVAHWPDEQTQSVALHVRVSIEENTELVLNERQPAVQG